MLNLIVVATVTFIVYHQYFTVQQYLTTTIAMFNVHCPPLLKTEKDIKGENR